jgi:transcriptional regulator with XRE-family HTH domain/DNA polymerase III delta prime subunit
VTTRQLDVVAAGFGTFGELLRYLRRRARLTQRELGVAVGYSEAQICRLEQADRLPDPATVAALFLPALRLVDEPELADRLMELAAAARSGRRRGRPPADLPATARTAARRRDLVAGPAPPPHLVNRPAVLGRLRARLAAERLVVLSGLAGTGKTTLAGALARELAGTHLVCWLAPSAGLPLSAEGTVGRLAGLLDQAGGPAGRGPGPGLGPGPPAIERVELLRAALDRQPTLLCIDNAHLLRGTPDVLALVAELAQARCAAVLLVSREELPLPGTAVLRLGGLTADEGRTLISRLGGGLPAALTDLLLARTGGSPMLLRLALARLAADEPDPALLVERLEAQPEVAAYLVETTLGQLAPASRRLVALLSVFRRPVDLHDETLLELCDALDRAADGHYDLLAAIGELQRRQIIDHPARAALPPLIRDHSYANLVADVSRRRRLHRVAAQWSERVADDVLEAAWHYARAGDIDAAAELLAARVTVLVERGQAFAAADLAADLLRAQRTRAEPGSAAVRRLLVARGDLSSR